MGRPARRTRQRRWQPVPAVGLVGPPCGCPTSWAWQELWGRCPFALAPQGCQEPWGLKQGPPRIVVEALSCWNGGRNPSPVLGILSCRHVAQKPGAAGWGGGSPGHTHTHPPPSLWYSTSLAWPWLSQEQPGQRARPVPSLPWQTSTEASLSPPGPHPGPAASPPNPPSAETPWKGGCASLWLPLRGGCPMPWRTCSPGMGWARELAQG